MPVLWHYMCIGLFQILFGELFYFITLTQYLIRIHLHHWGVECYIGVYSFCLQLLTYTSCTSSKLRFQSLRSQDGMFPWDLTISPRKLLAEFASCLLSGHYSIPRGCPLNTGFTVVLRLQTCCLPSFFETLNQENYCCRLLHFGCLLFVNFD